MKKPKIVVVGSANTDMVVRVNEIPDLGETVLGGEFMTVQGGKGANQAVAAARLGAEVTFVTRLGGDDFGKRSFYAYQVEGIHTQYIVWDPVAPSGVALILVNQQGENIIAVAPGANGNLSSADVKAAEVAFEAADVILTQLEVPMEAIQTTIDLAQKHHVRVILNPAPAKQLPRELLQFVDYLTPNEGELSVLTEYTGDTASFVWKDFQMQNNLKALIVTLGSQGARVLSDPVDDIVPGFSVVPVDTVAAGDAFNGGLAFAIAHDDDILEAVRFANAVGALSVTRAGAQPSLPRIDEVIHFLSQIS